MTRGTIRTPEQVEQRSEAPPAPRSGGVAASTDRLAPADVRSLRRATGFALAATSRIHRATRALEGELRSSSPPDGPTGEVIRRRVDEDFATFAAQPAQVALNSDFDRHVAYLRYVGGELAATVQAYAGLPEYAKDAVKQWGQTTQAALGALRPKGGNVPTAQELQDWRADYLDVLVGMVKGLDEQGAQLAVANTNGGADLGNAADGDDADLDEEEAAIVQAAWTDQVGKFAGADDDALADLKLLIAALDPRSIYQYESKSIVGGYHGKKVAGLKDPTARIDAQTPISEGLYNVQYQAEGTSYGGVLFTADDPEAKILLQLDAATRAATNRVSGLYSRRRNAPKAKVTLSKKQKEKLKRANQTKK